MRLIHRQAEQLEEIQKLTNELEKSPAVKLMRAEGKAAVLKKRQAAAEKLETLKKTAMDLAADQTLETFVERLNGLKNEKKKILAEMSEARGHWLQAKSGVDAQIRHEQEILNSSYDDRLDEAITFFRKTLDDLRKDGVLSTQRSGGARNIFTLKQNQKFESNFASVQGCLKFCQGCIKILEDEKLHAVYNETKVEQLKANVPKIVYSRSESEGNLRGLKVPDPTTIGLSDGGLECLKDRVMKKAAAVLAG